MIANSPRWWSSLPFVLALIVLGFLGWCVLEAVLYPYDGIQSLQPPGLIKAIDENSPVYGHLQVGDTIIALNGVPLIDAIPFYKGKRGGDIVLFDVNRNGQDIPLEIRLNDPSLKEVMERLMPLLVALIFWLIGVGVQTFKLSDGTPKIFFLFFQASAVMLAAGAISYAGPPMTSGLFSILLWIIGPLAVHFHLRFPKLKFGRAQRVTLMILYILAALGAWPYLIWESQMIHSMPLFTPIISLSELFLAVNLLIVVFLLFFTYRRTNTPGTRGKIRIAVLGGVLSTLPLVTLTILPEALLLQPIIPYSYAILVLGIFPLTYGYAIFRHHLIEIEKHVNRGATYIMVYSILAAFYLVLYATIHRWLPVTFVEEPFINTLLVIVLANLFIPLRRYVQKFVDIIFYGGWYDYRFAINHITQGLEQVTDLKVMAQMISERLVRTLRLEDTCVFLRDGAGSFSVIEVAPRSDLNAMTSLSFPVLPMSSLTYLLKMGEKGGRSSMRDALTEVILTPEEAQLLNSEQVHLWVPIIGHGEIQGYLALGPKYGGDVFSGEDLDILRLVAWQVASVIENIHLLTRLRQHAADLEQRVYERTAELYDAKERVEAILASVGDGVIVIDLDGNIVTLNAAFEEQSGFPAADLVSKNYFAFLGEYNDSNILYKMRAGLDQGEVWIGELFQQRKDGSAFNIQLTIAPVYNQNKKMIGYVGSQRDITKQRELDRLKNQFISDVSHELRTPATNLSLYLELLEHAPEERRSDYIQVLKSQCRLLVKLVEDILDLSRLEMGKSKKIEFTTVNLNQLTEQVIIAHRPVADASQLELLFQPDAELMLILGEQNQLARVVTNLVSNSIRYTSEGGVYVRTYNGHYQVCLEVRDTGIGIDAEDQKHLYERFYRGKQVRQSKIHGTGLGLAIVKEIVDLHDGSIQVQSLPGKGTIFRVWLPANNRKNGGIHSILEVERI